MAEQQRSMQYRAPVAANKAAVYHTTLTPMAEQRSTQYQSQRTRQGCAILAYNTYPDGRALAGRSAGAGS